MEVYAMVVIGAVAVGCIAVIGFSIAILTLKKYQEEKDDQGRPY